MTNKESLNKKDYKDALQTFEKLVMAAVVFSDVSGGIWTSNLGIEATKIYTRLTLSSMTINLILPENNINHNHLWDFPSIATLSRSFIETCHRYLYLSEQDLSDEEAEFRLKLYYFHMNSEKYRLFKETKNNENMLNEFEAKLPLMKDWIMKSAIYKSLTKQMAQKVRSGSFDMHFANEQIAERYSLIGGRFKSMYKLLSNHAHGMPFATYSQSNERGRGFENQAELSYMVLALMLLNQYLSLIITKQVELLSLENIDVDRYEYAKSVFTETKN